MYVVCILQFCLRYVEMPVCHGHRHRSQWVAAVRRPEVASGFWFKGGQVCG